MKALKMGVMVVALALSGVVRAQQSEPETIFLSPEECGQYGVEAANRIRKAQGLPLVEESATAQVIATVDYMEKQFIAEGGKLEDLDPTMAQIQMTMGCFNVQGNTGVPVIR